MKIFDDSSKRNIKWWNRNYFFIGTVCIVVLNICIFAFANRWQWNAFPLNGEHVVLQRLLRTFFNGFSHANWQHVLLNMLCFFVAGLYLERKMGSFGLVLFVIVSGFFAAGAMAMGSSHSPNAVGYSGINYFTYAYIIIEYLFSFQKSKRNRFSTVFGAIVIALIYFAMCFNGGTSSIGFEWYPYDLLNNLWHYLSFIGGTIFGLTIQIVILAAKKEQAAN